MGKSDFTESLQEDVQKNGLSTDTSDNTKSVLGFVKGILSLLKSPLSVKSVDFELSVEITRPGNTTPYSANAVINDTNAATLNLIDLDFSAIASANQKVEINSVSLISSNGGVATKLAPIIHFFKADTLTGQTLTDGTAFAPTYAELTSKRAALIHNTEWSNAVVYGSNAYQLMATELQRKCSLDSNKKLYMAVTAGAAYTPANAEKLYITVKGTLQ